MALQKINYLKLEDLKVGMEVTSIQLDKIYDTYIILSGIKLYEYKNREFTWKGIISKINKEQLCASEENEVLIYNSSLRAMENGTYDYE